MSDYAVAGSIPIEWVLDLWPQLLADDESEVVG